MTNHHVLLLQLSNPEYAVVEWSVGLLNLAMFDSTQICWSLVPSFAATQ